MSDGIGFAKGHGTQNDFVVLPDPDGVLDLTPARVAALCDRRRGLGADGVLRVVRWAALGAGPAPVGGVEWFMDYRNADGSLAEMCGNGVRVFAQYLRRSGLVGAGELRLGTRAGVRSVTFCAGREGGAGRADEVSVEMGPALVGPEAVATVGGREFPGVAVDVGNPHLACVTGADIAALDLGVPPGRSAELFPEGANVEFIAPVGAGGGPVPMRVHERGVGETRSCGTGTVAAVVAALRAAGRESGTVGVDTTGGRLQVTVRDGGGSTALRGPAVLVAHGELDRSWWEGIG